MSDTEDFLEHYGVKGMKWGKRKGAAQAIATKMTSKKIKLHEDARDGKGLAGLVAKADKASWGGNGRFEKYHNTRIEQLRSSQKQIDSGKKVARTIMFGAQYTVTPGSGKIAKKN